MAKTKQQQTLVIYFTICLTVVCLLMKVDSVSTVSIPPDGNTNILQEKEHQQQEQQQTDSNDREHNYFDQAKQEPTKLVFENSKIFENDNNDNSKEESLNEDLTKIRFFFGHPYESMNMFKRAPGGFVGMRGKKLYYDNFGDNINEEDSGNSPPWDQLQQNPDEDISWDEYVKPNVRRYKKASTTFYGVRGKKFATMNNGANPSSDNHRWQEFLQRIEEERVREAMLQDLIEHLTGTKNDLSNEMTKRAPTGFTGVRGKRPILNVFDSSMETLTKRGLGNNAFVGVRGKKDVSHQTFKRSPSEAESMPGGSGKRQRFADFNNKFVAVRGKKNSNNVMAPLNDSILPPSPAISSFDGKRLSNGFLGMQGKHQFPNDDISVVN